jgi:glycerol kinase
MNRATPLSGAISIDGGLSKNPYFCAFLAETLNRPVSVAASADLTGVGTAQLTLIGAGLATPASLPPAAAPSRVLQPQGRLSEAGRRRFGEALARCRNWR